MSTKSKRRTPGAGSVRQRGKGGLWSFQFSAPDDAGGRRLVSRGGFPTKDDAVRAMRKAQGDHVAGRVAAKKATGTVGGFLRSWLIRVEATDLKPSTKSFYSGMVAYVLSPVGGLENVKLAALDGAQVTAALNRLEAHGGKVTDEHPEGRPLGPTTKHSIHRVLGQALKEAVVEGRITTSPMDRIPKRERPKRAKQSRQGAEQHRWTTAEAAAFVRSAVADESPDGLALALMVRLGLRRGEALALRWRDVEGAGDDMVLHILQNRVVVDGKVHVQSTKTDESERSIPAASLSSLLEVARLRQEVDGEAAAGAWSGLPALDPDGLVFRRADGVDVHPQSVRHPLTRITKAAGIERRLSPHKLRHTAASVLVEQKLDVIVVASILGHSDASMILKLYAHADQRHVAAELARVGSAVYGESVGAAPA